LPDHDPTSTKPSVEDELKQKQVKGLTVLTWIKIAVVIGAVVVLGIVFAQNTEQVQTNILFLSVTMPRIVLLLITLAVGFALGVVFARWGRRR